MAANAERSKPEGAVVRGEKRPQVTLIIETSFASGRNIVKGIAQYAREHGPWAFHHEWRNTDIFFPQWMAQWQGDGFVARVESERIASAMRSFCVPVVDVLGVVKEPAFPVVHVDDRAIGRLAAEHLLEHGFRSFGFCGLKDANWSHRRRDAFVAALAAEGHECRVHEWSPRKRRSWSWERELREILDWLRCLQKPAGLMLSNDLHGHVVLEACRMGGVLVPDEVAMIGVDNDEAVCDICDPPLSSVIPDDISVGYEAAAMLDRLMRGASWGGRNVYVQPRGIHVRQSSDVFAVEDVHVAAAARFIRERARSGITVDDVVRQVPLCRSLLQRRFRAALGRSLHDEILNVRFDHAKFLLEEGNMALSLVAEKSGFKHQAYMGAVFKRLCGHTPLQHRHRSRLM